MSESAVADLSVLLRSRGWSIARENPNGADLWALDNRAEMYLPQIMSRGSFEWSDVIERIAAAHREADAVIAREVDLVRYDVTRFRVNGDIPDSPTVSLDAAASVVQTAFGMLRAAATAARRPRQSIDGNYSKLADEIVREARLGHTEPGSFVFPVMMKLSEPAEESQSPISDAAFHAVRPESPERRVTRTLAQAMSAFEKHVLQPAKEPRLQDLTPVIVAGGTKEMFAQLNHAISEPDVDWLETGFAWAPIETGPAQTPEQISVPADSEARELVSRSIKLLSTPASDPLRVLTGPIIHISHVPGDPLGEIAIQTPTPGGTRFGKVEVTVREAELTQIHHWMDSGEIVVVQGAVEHRRGRPARVKGVGSPTALSDALPQLESDT